MTVRDRIQQAAAWVHRWADSLPAPLEETERATRYFPLALAVVGGKVALVVDPDGHDSALWCSSHEFDGDEQAFDHGMVVLYHSLARSMGMAESAMMGPPPESALALLARRLSERQDDAAEVSGSDEAEADYDPAEDDSLHTGVWMAAWAEDVRQGQVVRLPIGGGRWGEGRVYELRKGLLMAPDNVDPNVHFMGGFDPDVCILFTCSDNCDGHHWEGRPRAPVYIRQDAPDHPDDLG